MAQGGVGIRRSRGRGRGDFALSADINVTSLVDVAFTLLVIFIITAPILQGGVEVTLPQANIQPISAMDDLFIVSIQADNMVYVEQTAMTIEEFESGFAQLANAAGIEQVFIRADDASRFGIAFRVVAVAQAAGIHAVFAGEPRPPAKR